MITLSLSDNRKEPGQTAGLALHWWQRLTTFGSSMIRVNNFYPAGTESD